LVNTGPLLELLLREARCFSCRQQRHCVHTRRSMRV
jgi:hypothetical protein